jgi:ribosomal protein S18 acetylase RimI-like enzyme
VKKGIVKRRSSCYIRTGCIYCSYPLVYLTLMPGEIQFFIMESYELPVKIKSLSELSFDDLFLAHEDAFGDYETKWSKAGYEKMLHRRGYVPELSFGAFDAQRLVSFTLNGIGMFNGAKTAYDTGTGTIKEYRGKGLATSIFKQSIPYLRAAGITQCLLEVLQHNTAAVSVYNKIGFSITRELDYFYRDTHDLVLNEKKLPAPYYIKETGIEEKEMAAMWDFIPSWQNSFNSIYRQPGSFKVIGAFDKSRLIGYGIVEPANGDIPQLSVCKLYRRKGIASAILKELLKFNIAAVIKVINIDIHCAAFTAFMKESNITKRGSQFEMIKNLV